MHVTTGSTALPQYTCTSDEKTSKTQEGSTVRLTSVQNSYNTYLDSVESHVQMSSTSLFQFFLFHGVSWLLCCSCTQSCTREL